MSLHEDVTSGLMCSWCGVYFEKEHGYPVLCAACWETGGRTIRYDGKWHHWHPGFQKAINKEL